LPAVILGYTHVYFGLVGLIIRFGKKMCVYLEGRGEGGTLGTLGTLESGKSNLIIYALFLTLVGVVYTGT